MAEKKELDAISGVETTGHEWDGIKELNNPLPRWWLYVLYATIVWAIGYWIVMPAWPTLTGYTKGVLGHSQRDLVAEQIEAAQDAQADLRAAIVAKDPAEIVKDETLLEYALAGGKAAFGDNCAPCHGSG
ncbi:MAG TPA: cbb3-type cytochrome c oxidase N-terminal domain-containing protein, partial [Kiloniellaceae bacterium]|nr:cbb3-type cytochrome c oxidase N-terminal domain-containing protein [Kiloniellaceae bacterium]